MRGGTVGGGGGDGQQNRTAQNRQQVSHLHAGSSRHRSFVESGVLGR